VGLYELAVQHQLMARSLYRTSKETQNKYRYWQAETRRKSKIWEM
jgi:hypothetical protein